MTEYQRLYFRERHRLRRKMGICCHCAKELAIENKSLCVKCKKRSDERYQRKAEQFICIEHIYASASFPCPECQ